MRFKTQSWKRSLGNCWETYQNEGKTRKRNCRIISRNVFGATKRVPVSRSELTKDERGDENETSRRWPTCAKGTRNEKKCELIPCQLTNVCEACSASVRGDSLAGTFTFLSITPRVRLDSIRFDRNPSPLSWCFAERILKTMCRLWRRFRWGNKEFSLVPRYFLALRMLPLCGRDVSVYIRKYGAFRAMKR